MEILIAINGKILKGESNNLVALDAANENAKN